MKIQLKRKSTKRIRTALQVLEGNSDIRINFKDDKAIINEMDDNQVALLETTIPKEEFKEYPEEEDTICVNPSELETTLKNIKSSRPTIIKNNDSIEVKGKKTEYQIPLRQHKARSSVNASDIEVEYEEKAEYKVKDLKKAITHAEPIAKDNITIETDEDGKAEIRAKSDTGKYRKEISKSEQKILGEMATSQKTQIPIKHLTNFLKAVGKREEIEVYTKTDAPLKIEKDNHKYLIAPRIEV